MKTCIVIGTRPEIIQSVMVTRELRKQGHEVITVHTGQHYHDTMSGVFFRDMDIPESDYDLKVGSNSHGLQTGRMLAQIEHVFLEDRPDWVLVFGDTNSTLAGALAAVKLHIPVAHIEAGMRSFNREMPEEINRILIDHCADLHLCSTATAVHNLLEENIAKNVRWVGDVMYDAVLQFGTLARKRSTILNDLGLTPKRYLLATVHRPYNTDDPERLQSILEAFIEIGEPIVFSMHPRTCRCMAEFGLNNLPAFQCSNVQLVEPVGYLDMLMLEQHARLILTDSGGVQKEAYFFAVPCVTLRPETEWVETVDAGWNVLVGANKEIIINAVRNPAWRVNIRCPPIFGDGTASQEIVRLLERA